MKAMGRYTWVGAIACLACVLPLCGIGCAAGEVVSTDRAALWNAALRAAQEGGFVLVSADETKGLIVSSKTALADGVPAERLRMMVTCRQKGDSYRASVVVRRSAPPSDLKGIETTIRYGRKYKGGTGRTARDYGSVATRDMGVETSVLDRIRRLLSEPSPGGARP